MSPVATPTAEQTPEPAAIHSQPDPRTANFEYERDALELSPTTNNDTHSGDSMESPEDASHQPPQEQLPTWKQDLVGKCIELFTHHDLESPAWFSCRVDRFNADGAAAIIFNDGNEEVLDLIGGYRMDGKRYQLGQPVLALW